MPDHTSSDESLPSGSHPSAQPETATRFQSYAEYLARLDRSPFQPQYQGSEERLWLASFTEDGRYIKRYTCILRHDSVLKGPTSLEVEGIRPDTTVLSSSDFRALLQTTDENVPYRIVIAAGHRTVPSPMIEDVLGLGLDLEPEIFDYMKSTVAFQRYTRQENFPLPWFRDAPALRIGSDVLCILDKAPERRSKTAIIFLREDSGFEVPPPNSLGSTMFSSKRPSQMRERYNQNVYQNSDVHPQYYRKSLVERYITEAIESKTQFGPGNFLYVCLAALLELHLSTPPTSVFHFEDSRWRRVMMHKYRGNCLKTTNEPLPLGTYPDMGWSQLRTELDHQRYTLRWMTRFFKRYLDYSNEDLQAAFEDMRERFKLRVQDLEEVESQLRDQMASEGINKSIRMAEMSILESKRVMLCTLVVVPFSLLLLTGSK
ncbi:hypothetical protein AA0116_g2903 [Alternaria tenuissima]|nr:hypothetical protein AA0116_g2903 [Alternaria tenuissima]